MGVFFLSISACFSALPHAAPSSGSPSCQIRTFYFQENKQIKTLWRRLGVEEMVLESWLGASITLPNPWLALNISEKVENWGREDQVTVWDLHWYTGQTWCWAWVGPDRGFVYSRPEIVSWFLPALQECRFSPIAPFQVVKLTHHWLQKPLLVSPFPLCLAQAMPCQDHFQPPGFPECPKILNWAISRVNSKELEVESQLMSPVSLPGTGSPAGVQNHYLPGRRQPIIKVTLYKNHESDPQ